MSTPKTLLQMAGASLEPGKFSESAVVIIDAQNEYLNGKLPLPGVEAALDNIAILLKAARAANAPVIHVQHKGRAGGLFDPGADAFKLAPQAASQSGEAIVEKPLPNSFAQTNLQDVLAKTGRKSLIVAGFMTHMCVSSTVRAALDLGYRTTVVADAAGTRDLPDPTGGPALSAAELHRAALAGLADRFAIVTNLAGLKT
ncbi:MAG: cysteine hydrolase [Xanthobacteraceae bacterium]|nr:cysteine hydrolase [Xanthobacteraceae bacterium]